MGPVYYCPCHPYNTILLITLKFYADLQKVTSKTIEHCDFFTLKVALGSHSTGIITIWTILRLRLSE